MEVVDDVGERLCCRSTAAQNQRVEVPRPGRVERARRVTTEKLRGTEDEEVLAEPRRPDELLCSTSVQRKQRALRADPGQAALCRLLEPNDAS